ncbi:MAG: peroxiredoxin [Betaproteobacteria bacterium]|nr:MAG: peroxiredoxin [Betaproteobacteria bacterium]
MTAARKVADFAVPSTSGTFRLSDHAGKTVVLYFYPKDNTPGCTTEGAAFRDAHDAFREAHAVVAGVSRDSLASHAKFRAKMDFPFDLLSDADGALCERFGVIRDKKMYGRTVRGIERSTFVIDGSGRLVREWRGVKVPGHVDDVLAFVRSL